MSAPPQRARLAPLPPASAAAVLAAAAAAHPARVPRLFFLPGDPRTASSPAVASSQPYGSRLFGAADLASLLDADPLAGFESLRNSRAARRCECAPGTKRAGTAVVLLLLVVLMYVSESSSLLHGRGGSGVGNTWRPGGRGGGRLVLAGGRGGSGGGGRRKSGAAPRGGGARSSGPLDAEDRLARHEDADADANEDADADAMMELLAAGDGEGAATRRGHEDEEEEEAEEEEEEEEVGPDDVDLDEPELEDPVPGADMPSRHSLPLPPRGGAGALAAAGIGDEGLTEDEYRAEVLRLRARKRNGSAPRSEEGGGGSDGAGGSGGFHVPGGGAAGGAGADTPAPPAAPAPLPVMPALTWARARILAFQRSIMTDAGGQPLGSLLPIHTQEEPYEQQRELSGDYGRLAEHGLLLTPHYYFTRKYNVTLDGALVAWVVAAGAAGAAGGPLPPAPPAAQPDGSFAPAAAPGGDGGDGVGRYALWGPKTGIRRWGVSVPTRLAPQPLNESESSPRDDGARVDTEIDPDAHARAVAPCVLEHMYAGTYFHDLDNLHRAIVNENRYPPLNALMRGGDMRAVGRAVFRPADKQPLPHVLTAFNVVVGDTGYLFARHDGGGNGGVRRINRERHAGSHESFRPIQCLYREFDHSRGGHDAVYSDPVGPVHDEVIVLSQYWGQHVYHLYEEDFIRLAFMLDYAHAHPHVKLHVKLHDNAHVPHAWLTDLMELFGIHPSRAVWGSVAAAIVHVPEGTPCGEPYAYPQVALREALRARLRLRPALDLLGDGAAVARGFARDTRVNASAGIAAASRAYVADVTACVLRRYAQTAAPASGSDGGAHAHPLAALAALAAGAAPPPPQPQAGEGEADEPRRRPKLVLLERHGSRHVPNFGELRDALASLPVRLVVFGAEEPGSQADHLAAFADADVIVGPHGAGLTNALTSWPGTVLVEFIPDSGLSNLVYMQAGLLLGLDFQSFTPRGSSYYGPIHVDVARVRQAVADAIR